MSSRFKATLREFCALFTSCVKAKDKYIYVVHLFKLHKIELSQYPRHYGNVVLNLWSSTKLMVNKHNNYLATMVHFPFLALLCQFDLQERIKQDGTVLKKNGHTY